MVYGVHITCMCVIQADIIIAAVIHKMRYEAKVHVF